MRLICCCCCCLHIKNRSALCPVPSLSYSSRQKETNFRGHKLSQNKVQRNKMKDPEKVLKKVPTLAIFWFYRLRRSRSRQKTKHRLPAKHYLPPYGITAIFWFHRLRQSRYRQKTKHRLPPNNYRRIALPSRLCPRKKALPTITLIILLTGSPTRTGGGITEK